MRSLAVRAAVLVSMVVFLTACASASPEVSPTPSATASPSPTATPQPALVDLTCDELLDVQAASDVLGVAMTPDEPAVAEDPAVAGGVWCMWRGDGYQFLGIGAFPASAAPEQYSADPADECEPGWICDTWQVQGDIWVNVNAPDAASAARILALVAPTLAGRTAPAATPVSGQWAVPTCEELTSVVQSTMDRTDLGDFSGDNVPTGPTWDLLVANGAALWCGWHGDGQGGYADQVEIFLGPGSATAAADALADGWQETTVDGASQSAYLPSEAPLSSRLIATVGDNSLEVTTRFADAAQQAALAAAVIEFMASR